MAAESMTTSGSSLQGRLSSWHGRHTMSTRCLLSGCHHRGRTALREVDASNVSSGRRSFAESAEQRSGR